MRKSYCLLLVLGSLLIISVPRSAFGQSSSRELELVMNNLVKNAYKVEVGGVEFKGYKTGPTEFTDCNRKKIDIGNKTPTKTGPCPDDGKPRNVHVFEGIIIDFSVATSMLKFMADDGKAYEVYLAEEAKEIVLSQLGSGSSNSSTKAYNVLFGAIVGGGKARSPASKMQNLDVKDLTSGKKIAIVSLVDGRAEAILR
jgi:hypothetical protein